MSLIRFAHKISRTCGFQRAVLPNSVHLIKRYQSGDEKSKIGTCGFQRAVLPNSIHLIKRYQSGDKKSKIGTCASQCVLQPNSSHLIKRYLSGDEKSKMGTCGFQRAVLPNLTHLIKRYQSRDEKPKIGNDPLDTSFEDAVASHKSKTTGELIRAYVVYVICSIEWIVQNNMKLMKLAKNVLGETVFIWIMKATFYGHFVAGEDEVKIKPTLTRLRQFGVKSILDYSVEEDLSNQEAEKREVESSAFAVEVDDGKGEDLKKFKVDKKFADRRYKVTSAKTYFYKDELSCERNKDTFITCIQAIRDYHKEIGSGASESIGAVKLTALGKPKLLLQLSEVIVRARGYMKTVFGRQSTGSVLSYHASFAELEKKILAANIKDTESVRQFLKQVSADDEGVIHLFPWSGLISQEKELNSTFRVPDPVQGKMVRFITQLSQNDEEMFRNMIKRTNTIIEIAKEMDVRLMIDAEQSYFQPAITRLTVELMRKHNKDKAIVFNTYQNYMQNARKELLADLEQAKRQKFFFGAKLVRGAYLEQERERAAVMGYADPTNPDFDATSAMYHNNLKECMQRMAEFTKEGQGKKLAIMVATHNENTVRYAIEQMKHFGIGPGDKLICFGQLLGMCDYVTFPLGQSGYSVYKYVPYGPVAEVLPYLSRRAYENKCMLQKTRKEKRLLLKAIFNRLAKGQVWYTPKGNYLPA